MEKMEWKRMEHTLKTTLHINIYDDIEELSPHVIMINMENILEYTEKEKDYIIKLQKMFPVSEIFILNWTSLQKGKSELEDFAILSGIRLMMK